MALPAGLPATPRPATMILILRDGDGAGGAGLGSCMRVRWGVMVVCIGAAAAAVGIRHARRAPFDAKRVADAETRMWFAGASGQTPMVSSYAEEMLRAQFNLTAYPSREVARRRAIAAARFRHAKTDPSTHALPYLTEAYRVLAAASGSAFNPRDAALAELAWWTARRSPSGSDVKVIGEHIADLYRILYGGDHPALAEAGRRRAEAASLRDAKGVNADWHRIRMLLRKSYAELGRAARSIRPHPPITPFSIPSRPEGRGSGVEGALEASRTLGRARARIGGRRSEVGSRLSAFILHPSSLSLLRRGIGTPPLFLCPHPRLWSHSWS